MTDDSTGRAADQPTLDEDVRALLADDRLWGVPGADLADRVVAVVRSEAHDVSPEPTAGVMPRWARPALLGAAAVVALMFGGIALFSAVDGTSTDEVVAAVLSPTGLVPGVDGRAEFTDVESGVSIELDAPSLPSLDGGWFYEAWVVVDDGRVVPVGTFRGGDGVGLWAGVELAQIRAFSITREEAETAESPEQRSSGEVVLKATMSAD